MNIKFNWSFKPINEANVTIHFSEHGNDRRVTRDNIPYSRIEEIIMKYFKEKIQPYTQRFTHFVIHNKKDNLNIVIQVIKIPNSKDYLINVVTVMVKKHFEVKHDDKLIGIYESLLKFEEFITLLN